MKTKMRIKLVSIAMVVFSLFSVAACNKPGGASSSGTELPPVEETETIDGIDRSRTLGMIVEGGKTEYKIVYAADGGSAQLYAASELANFMAEATGASLPVVADTSVEYGDDGRYISVGDTALLKKSGIEMDGETLNRDGFVMKTQGNNLYIGGANDRGVLYGVYDFLEKMLGVRFVAPEITHVPEVGTLPLYAMDVTEIPAFEYRNLYSYSMRTNDPFYTRLRFNAPERTIGEMYGGRTDWYTELGEIEKDYDNLAQMFPSYPGFNVIHNAFYWVNPADWYDTHPEFFAVDAKGNTIRDAAGTICQLNLTNGITDDGKLDETMDVSVAKVALEALKKFILDDPDARVFFFGHNDWDVYDLSPRSQAAAELYGGQAGILMRFVNVLSDEINKWLDANGMEREITIATWAYLYTKKAPVKEDGRGGYVPAHESVIPRDNISIRIAPIELDWYYSVNDPNQLGEYSSLVLEWTHLTDNFMIWTYETNFGNYLFYYPSMRQWSDNVKFFREIGVEYLMMQDNYHGFGSWQADMHTYVASKLLWNPDVKVQPLIDEFLYYYFGENGAEKVAAMMQLFDDHFALLQAEEPDFWMPFRDDDGSTLMNPDYFPIELLEEAESLIEEAIADNLADPSLDGAERVRRDKNLTSALLTPQSMILHNYAKYYSGSRTAYAAEFIENAEYVGVLSLSEVTTLINYKASLGLS
ncbi:MAG: DUF4838 domain-containing protein [Coriobacteriales bacterium]|jgi:hypothetical protein